VTRLETLDVTMRFGGHTALDAVSIVIRPGHVTGLIGPNGAGKTTLFNVITGLLSPTQGKVRFDDRDITTDPPHKRAKLGVARTFQRLELFTSLSVRDNVRVAGEIRNSWGFRQKMDCRAEAARVIELVGLSDVADREVSEIPTGQARVVELARALMIKPSLLLLDEPASGQTEEETATFGRLLQRLAREDGLGICLVEHDMSLVMHVCETIHVLEFGRLIASGEADVVRNDPAVIDAYLGAPESVG
jgi:branched-chain amino acid transport system ATP-binding protein